MSITVKNAGAYADIVGVFHKRAGAYEAVQGVYAKSGGVYGRVDAAPPVVNPRFALVGDSLTQYSNKRVSLNGVTLTRDAAGIVSVPKSAHGIYGNQPVGIVNTANTTYEGVFTSTYIDANNFSYPSGVSGSAGTTVGGTLTAASIQNRFNTDGYFAWLDSEFDGGLAFVANYGQGGDRLDEMGSAVTAACASVADFVILAGGINDINSYGASGATVTARAQAHVDTILAAGKKCVLVGITPLGSASATAPKTTATVDANSGFAAIAAANSGRVFFANPYPDLVDPGSGVGAAYSWVTYDGIHWGSRTGRIVGQKIAAAIASAVTTSSMMPNSSSNLPSLGDFTAIKQYGAWDATGGGYAGTGFAPAGANANVTPRLQVFSSNAATTYVPSLVDRGDGNGYWQRLSVTPGGAHRIDVYMQSNAGETLASLGVATGDRIRFAMEVKITNGAASNCWNAGCYSQSQASGLYGSVSVDAGTSADASRVIDTYEAVFVTGPLVVSSSFTHLQTVLYINFSAASASACQVDIGRLVMFKDPA